MDMYNSKFLRSIRSSERGADTYVCGRVCAEMRKSTVYRVDVLVDSCGIVQESQCECAAGMGPEAHCKHVCVVLLALTRAKGGILCSETCTQRLQTFHHVSKHTGSPVKMQNMNLRPGGSLQRVIDLDPSPPDIDDIPDDEYCERFRSVMLNLDVPGLSVLKMYPPANVHAVVHDHHYLKKDQETKILDEFLITEITDAQVKGIEVETRGQSSNKA